MGFNYLQTDDRDDYFKRFDKSPKKRLLSVTLLSSLGEVIFDDVKTHVLRSYCKKEYLFEGKSAKHIWRIILEEKGYKIINNYKQ